MPDAMTMLCRQQIPVSQVVMVTDPKLLPPLFDRAKYPPNANTLDRPVDQLLHVIDAVSYGCFYAESETRHFRRLPTLGDMYGNMLIPVPF